MTLNDTKTHPILTDTTTSPYRTIVNNKVQNGAVFGIPVDNAKKEPPLRSGSKVNREASNTATGAAVGVQKTGLRGSWRVMIKDA
jgi:hypothetical protein